MKTDYTVQLYTIARALSKHLGAFEADRLVREYMQRIRPAKIWMGCGVDLHDRAYYLG